MILCGINKQCFEMDRYFRGEKYATKYIHTMDMLTNYKYNLKEKALKKHSSCEEFKEETNYVYNK